MLFASQTSNSVQHEPYLPVPELTSVLLGSQPSELASPLMNFISCGHCASQYPVPYLAPALLPGYLLLPPSGSISVKYTAPFVPHGKLDTSTSNVNSRFFSLNWR